MKIPEPGECALEFWCELAGDRLCPLECGWFTLELGDLEGEEDE